MGGVFFVIFASKDPVLKMEIKNKKCNPEVKLAAFTEQL